MADSFLFFTAPEVMFSRLFILQGPEAHFLQLLYFSYIQKYRWWHCHDHWQPAQLLANVIGTSWIASLSLPHGFRSPLCEPYPPFFLVDACWMRLHWNNTGQQHSFLLSQLIKWTNPRCASFRSRNCVWLTESTVQDGRIQSPSWKYSSSLSTQITFPKAFHHVFQCNKYHKFAPLYRHSLHP